MPKQENVEDPPMQFADGKYIISPNLFFVFSHRPHCQFRNVDSNSQSWDPITVMSINK